MKPAGSVDALQGFGPLIVAGGRGDMARVTVPDELQSDGIGPVVDGVLP